jgi:hypothetical protein
MRTPRSLPFMIETTVRSADLCSFLELLEPKRQTVPIRTILKPSWSVDQCPGDALETEFQKRPVVNFEQPIGHVNSVIGVVPIR